MRELSTHVFYAHIIFICYQRTEDLEQTIYDASPETYEMFNINTKEYEFKHNGKNFKILLPNTHEVVLRNAHSRTRNEAKSWQAFVKKFKDRKSRGRYSGSILGKQALGAAMALNPESSGETMEITVALCWMSLLADVGMMEDVSPLQIAKIAPSYTTLNRTVADLATDCLYLEKKILLDSQSKTGVSTDKGGSIRSHFIKQLSYTTIRSNPALFGWLLRRFIPNIDDSGGTSEECADALLSICVDWNNVPRRRF